MSRPFCLFCVLLAPGVLHAAAPPVPSPTAYGDRLRDDYFRRQADRLADDGLDAVRSRADWDAESPKMRRQFLDMLGLWPLPEKADLKAAVVGRAEEETFVVERLHYQSLPGLYVTANLYLPKGVTKPCPAILYVCGHGPTVIDGVAYGNKVTYQHHAIWFARNGYVCLIVDTLQLGEVPGLHHGTSRFGMWWWLSLGYTPAGIECWNGMRGIDYLLTRKEVDGSRIGVTGRSGGGATSWWVMAADERVKCGVPVAGIADLRAHVSEGYPGRLADGVVAGHCDCMYTVNTYRWDYSKVMALCAPRPVLLGNSDADAIFPVPGYRRMSERVAKLYDRLGARESFGLLETKGEHKDTEALRLGAFRWMNRHLKGDGGEVKDFAGEKLGAKGLKVFGRLPADSINDVIHERFRRPARLELPEGDDVIRRWWEGKSAELKAELLEKCFRGWPASPPALGVKAGGDETHDGVRVRAYDYESEEGVPLRLWLVSAAKAEAKEVIGSVVDEAGWGEWVKDLGPQFRGVLYGKGNAAPRAYPKRDVKRFLQLRATMAEQGWGYAVIAPRGVGPTRWSEAGRHDGKPAGHQIRRRFALLGQTWEGQQVWDVRRAVACVRQATGKRMALQGAGPMGVVALYAGVYEPGVSGVEMWRPPASHREGPTFLNVLRVLDVQQAAGLMGGRRVRVMAKERAGWEWAERLGKAGWAVEVREVGE